MKQETAYLLLEDGSVFVGQSFGARKEVMGEVVFTTAMTGYQETLTDPSYCSQLVTFTYPLIGNYGINPVDFESVTPHLAAVIVKEHCLEPNHWKKVFTLDEWLKLKGIPGICQVDTRALTRRIRTKGTMKGSLIIGRTPTDEDWNRLAQYQFPRDQVARVSTAQAYHCPGSLRRVAVLDFGVKSTMIHELIKRKCDVWVLPYDTTAEEIFSLQPDGVLLSNGPGNPKDVPSAIQTIQSLLGKVPIFGICLGHQLLALALGADTEKMAFGHRGANHPVQHVESKQTFMTSQNHGYTVTLESLGRTELKITHINVNDGTVEGLAHPSLPAFSVQFHPEATPGPYDSSTLFDQFMDMIDRFNINRKKEAAVNAEKR